MQITILGGGGFLGRKVAQRLAADGALGGRAVTGLTLFDLARRPPAGGAVSGPLPRRQHRRCRGGQGAIPPGTDVVVHLAAVVSAQAEADYDLGLTVNVRGTER